MNEITWNVDPDNQRHQHAFIGRDGNDWVFGIVHPGYNTVYGWEVFISPTSNPNDKRAWMVAVGDTDDLEKVRADCEYYGKEWIKGDSLIWSEA